MVTRNASAAALACGLLVGLLGTSSAAADEIVVYGSTAHVGLNQAVLKAAVAEHDAALSENLRTLLDRDLKTEPKPQLELAVGGNPPTRG